MYRQKDIDNINENITLIKNEASKIYKTLYEPTLKEIAQVYNYIIDYIKRNKKIVYGGFAQNLLILNKNKNDGFYTEMEGIYFNYPDLADIEFYSDTPLKDLLELTEELFAQKFKYIEGKEGVHPETYKIFVNFINYCDISYIPSNIYKNVKCIEINGIKCIDPHFMLMDCYRIFNDPMTSYWRLDKTITRFQKLISYYPLDKPKNDKLVLSNIDKNIHRYIKKKIIENSNFVLVGYNAYNYYAKKANYETIDLQPFEIITDSFVESAKQIYNILKKKYNNIKVIEYSPFYNFFDLKIEYYHNNKLLLTLYNNHSRCTVYNYSEQKKIYYGTFNLVFMYMLYSYNYSMINNKNINNYLILCNNLYDIRNKYLDLKKINITDKSPFQEFTYKCFGIPVDPIRESFLNIIKKKNTDKIKKFKYNPSGKQSKIPNYIFKDTTGNVIKNKKYLIFKN